MDIKNKFSNSKVFFEELKNYFNTNIENEKYEKALKLLKIIPDIEEVEDTDKILYYGNIGLFYYDFANIKCKKYGLSDGKRYNAEKILEDKNRQLIEDVINEEVIAFNYCKNGVDLEIINNILEQEEIKEKEKVAKKLLEEFENNRETFRKITQELSILYYLIWDEEKFIQYGKYAEKYNSLNAMNLLLKYYCNKMDLDNANNYYNLIHTYPPINFYGSVSNNLALKVEGHKIYWDFLFDIGDYKESLKIGEECKEFVLKYKLDNEILKYVEEHISKCKKRIKELDNSIYTEEKLLNYFDEEIINLMSDNNKIYIITSLNIYEYMKSNEITMDYSATLMPILKAIENIMFEIICENYHTFILEKKEIDKNLIKEFINKRTDNIIRKMYKLELGDALGLIGNKNIIRYNEKEEIIPNKYFLEFCNKNNVIDSTKVIVRVYEELDKLRKNRNKVAHKDRINEEDVTECYNILLENIKFIEYIYKNFKFIFKKNNK